MRAIAIALGTCTLASLVSASFVDFTKTPTSDIAPRKVAFSIWGLIYTLLAASAVVLGSTRASPSPLYPHVLVCVSLAITCVWSATATRVRGVAFVALATSALTAWSSLYAVRSHLLLSAAYGLLTGWLSVATTISSLTDDTRILVLASTLVGSGCVAIGTPWPSVALFWGLVCQQNVDGSVWASILVTLAALGGSVFRALS